MKVISAAVTPPSASDWTTFTSDSLDIVGAGTNNSSRKIKFWAEGEAAFTGTVTANSFAGDGGGLWLAVGPNSKSWIFRYMIDGKSREIGIGSFDDVGLAEACEKARQYRAMVHRKPEDGGPLDPLDER